MELHAGSLTVEPAAASVCQSSQAAAFTYSPKLPLPAEGFASGSLDEDAYAPRSFIDKGLEVMVSQSYSKNLGRASAPMLSANP